MNRTCGVRAAAACAAARRWSAGALYTTRDGRAGRRCGLLEAAEHRTCPPPARSPAADLAGGRHPDQLFRQHGMSVGVRLGPETHGRAATSSSSHADHALGRRDRSPTGRSCAWSARTGRTRVHDRREYDLPSRGYCRRLTGSGSAGMAAGSRGARRVPATTRGAEERGDRGTGTRHHERGAGCRPPPRSRLLRTRRGQASEAKVRPG